MGPNVQKIRKDRAISRKLSFRVMSLAVLAACSLAAIPSAQANATTYSLTLIPYNGSLYGGTGTLTLNPSPSTSNPDEVYTINGQDSLTLTLVIDSVTFTATGPGCTGEYTDGTLDSLWGCSFTSSNSKDSLNSVNLSGSSGTYQGDFGNVSNSGSISIGAGLDPPVAPEPSTFILWGTGLLAFGVILRKKMPPIKAS